MILHPSALALALGSLLTAGLLLYASGWAAVILRYWDPTSGSSGQLELERRTVLLSTLISWALVFEVLALALLVFTADSLAPLFTGAMCAAGTLAASVYGYPALLVGLAASLGAGLWLIVNHADTRSDRYPLLRLKYAALLALTPLVLLAGALRVAYLGSLEPEVITSCCGALFSASGQGLGAGLAALPGRFLAPAFWGVTAAGAAAGLTVARTGRGSLALGLLGAAAVPVGLAGLVAYVSPYVYELPAHRCPFCLLQREYGFVGWPLYAALLGGALAAVGAAVVHLARGRPGLEHAAAGLRRRLALTAALLFAGLVALAAYEVLSSRLRL